MNANMMRSEYNKLRNTGIFLLFLGGSLLGLLFFLGDDPRIQSYLESIGKRNLYILLSVAILAAVACIVVYFYRKRKSQKEQEKSEPEKLSFAEGHEMSLRRVNAEGEANERNAGKQTFKKPLFLVFGDTQPSIHLGSDLGARVKGYPFSWNTIGQGVFVGLRSKTKAPKANRQQTSAWQEYLDWLFQTRAKRPLSGIILVVKIDDLANSTADASVERVADLLRDNRVQSVPVYIVIRSVDSLAGFSDAYLGPSKGPDSDVLGLTFSKANTAQRISKREELDVFFAKLNHALLKGLKTHSGGSGLGQYLFVQQLQGIKERLLTVVDTISAYDLTPRGIYFTEDYQLNESLNFLTEKLATTYQYKDISKQTFTRSDTKKTYSIKNTLRRVVLSESGIVGDNSGFLRARQQKLLLTFTFTGLLIAGTVGLWSFVYQQNISEFNSFSQSAKQPLLQYKNNAAQAAALPESYVPALDFLSPKKEENGFLQLASLGLSKHETLDANKKRYYTQIAQEEFAAAIATEQLNQADKYSLSSGEAEQKKAFNALLAVKLLSTSSINDEEQRQTFGQQVNGLLDPLLKKYWEEKFLTVKHGPQLVGRLMTHLQSSQNSTTGFDLTPNNKQRLKTIQARLAVTPLPQRLYGLIKNQAENQYPTPFDLSLELGEGFDQVFSVSPRSDYEFNRLFTREGFMQEYLGREAKIAELAAIDAWVLGERTSPAKYQGEELSRLQRNLRDLFLQDYKQRWQSAIRSIEFLPASNLAETVGQLRVLSESGLYRNWLSAINDNTVYPAAIETETTANAKAETVGSTVSDEKSNGDKDKATQYVSLALQKKFANYNKLFAKKIDDIETTLAALSSYMSDLEAQSATVQYYALNKVIQKFSARGEADPINHLFTLARNLPEPFSTQLQQISSNSWRILLSLAVNDLNRAWESDVYKYFVENLQGRYPLSQTHREASLASLSAFYGKAGLLDVFYQNYLKPLLGNEGKLEGLNISGIQRVYKHAEYIREGLFTDSGELKVEFKIEPIALSQPYLSSTLSLDGVFVKYNHGVPIASHIVWPNPDLAAQEASITLNPLNRETNIEQLTVPGEWGLFRLLDQADTQSLGDRVREISFSARSGVAHYLITAPGSINPLTKDLFSGFSLPAGLLK